MSDLEQAVHALTRETRTKVIQDGDGISRTVAITHAPLLTQLAEAVTSSLGSGSGGGGGKAEKNVLDSEAMYQTAIIRAAIGDWCRLVKVVATRDLRADLEAWHERYHGDAAESYIRHLKAWEAWIVRKLDPPKRMEVTADCPTCGKGVYTDADGATLKFPILIEYREGQMVDALGECRACEKTWRGERELRQLRWDLDTTG